MIIFVGETKLMEMKKLSVTHVSPVTIEQLSEMQRELRQLNLQWADLLVTLIKNDKEIDDLNKTYQAETDRTKIYRVFNNGIRNNGWRTFVYGYAKKLRTSLLENLRKMHN